MPASSAKEERQNPGNPPKSGRLAPHLIILSVCFSILTGTLMLSPAGPGEEHLYIGSFPIPDTCVFKNLTGLSCPGCGLTRSLVAAARGDVKQSFQLHYLGLPTLFYVLLQFLYRISWIVAPALTTRIFVTDRYLNRGVIVLGGLFLLNWILLFLL